MSARTSASEFVAKLRWRDQRRAPVDPVDTVGMLRGNHVQQINESLCPTGLFCRPMRPVKPGRQETTAQGERVSHSAL